MVRSLAICTIYAVKLQKNCKIGGLTWQMSLYIRKIY